MNLKKNIILGMITGLVGMALISGGTVAYFSDSVQTQNEFLSGTLELDLTDEHGIIPENDVWMKFENKKPGDTFDYQFDLINAGSLGMKHIKLYSDHEMIKGHKDFAKQIIVKKLVVNEEILVNNMTLHDLRDNPTVLAENIKSEASSIPVYVEFEFIRTEGDQNVFQGNEMDLIWIFEAVQEDGE